jgi:hypothetical protein
VTALDPWWNSTYSIPSTIHTEVPAGPPIWALLILPAIAIIIWWLLSLKEVKSVCPVCGRATNDLRRHQFYMALYGKVGDKACGGYRLVEKKVEP